LYVEFRQDAERKAWVGWAAFEIEHDGIVYTFKDGDYITDQTIEGMIISECRMFRTVLELMGVEEPIMQMAEVTIPCLSLSGPLLSSFVTIVSLSRPSYLSLFPPPLHFLSSQEDPKVMSEIVFEVAMRQLAERNASRIEEASIIRFYPTNGDAGVPADEDDETDDDGAASLGDLFAKFESSSASIDGRDDESDDDAGVPAVEDDDDEDTFVIVDELGRQVGLSVDGLRFTESAHGKHILNETSTPPAKRAKAEPTDEEVIEMYQRQFRQCSSFGSRH